MSTSRRRLLLVVVTGMVLLVQGAYSFATVPEPYPTVRMPGFGSAATAEGLFPKRTLTVRVGYSDGSERQSTVREVMRGVRPTSARPALERAVWPGDGREAAADDPEVRQWWSQNVSADDGHEPEWLELTRCEADIDIRTAEAVVRTCDSRRVEL